jgi:hypothetical protein
MLYVSTKDIQYYQYIYIVSISSLVVAYRFRVKASDPKRLEETENVNVFGRLWSLAVRMEATNNS